MARINFHEEARIVVAVGLSAAVIGLVIGYMFGRTSTMPDALLSIPDTLIQVLAGIGLAGALISVQSYIGVIRNRRAETWEILNAQLEALYSPHPAKRAAARDTIGDLIHAGVLTDQQTAAASAALRHWVAVYDVKHSVVSDHEISGSSDDGGDGPSGAVAWNRASKPIEGEGQVTRG